MDKYKRSKKQRSDLKVVDKKGFSKTHLFKVTYVICLILIVNLTYFLAFPIRYGFDFFNTSMRNFNDYLVTVPLLSISVLLFIDIFQMTHFYRRTFVHIINAAFKFAALQTIATTAVAFFVRAFSFPRAIIIVGFFVIFLMTTLLGVLALHINRRLYKQGRMVIIGATEREIKRFVHKIQNNLKSYNTEILATCTVDRKEQVYDQIMRATELVLSPGISDKDKRELLLFAHEHNKVVFLVPSVFDLAIWRAPMVQFDDTASFMVERVGLTFEQRLIKRFFDIVFSLIVLIVTAPIMLIVYLAIRIDSSGPAVFKQERMTINNRIYNIYKFRTMRLDAEEQTGPVISGANDPRVTKIGSFLRKSKMDELPQFINVLKGDMSVVGPRSEREFFVRQFGEEIPGYNNRFRVKAGITGYAQVAGKYDTPPEEKLRYDLAYIKNYSILFDLRLIAETISVIFRVSLFNKEFPQDKELK